MGQHADKLRTVRLTTPITEDQLKDLEIGTVVYIDGHTYTGREKAYEKFVTNGEPLPDHITGMSNVNFHCSPAASVNDDGSFNVGAVTATASFRFAKWLARWFEISGCKVVIGKGGMSAEDYKNIFVPAGAVYLTTVGYGTGALLGRGIVEVAEVEGLDEMGIAQAMWLFKVEKFGPFLVESDLQGNSLFESQGESINPEIDRLYDGLKKPALSRYGETDDKTSELI